MRNKQGLTITERLHRDITHAEAVSDPDLRRALAHMAIAAAELAIDFNLITFAEWGEITRRAFDLT